MSDLKYAAQLDAETELRFQKIASGLKKRRAASRRLKTYGVLAILTALSFLVILLTTIISNGYTALQQTELLVELSFPEAKLGASDGSLDLKKSQKLIEQTYFRENSFVFRRANDYGNKDSGRYLLPPK